MSVARLYKQKLNPVLMSCFRYYAFLLPREFRKCQRYRPFTITVSYLRKGVLDAERPPPRVGISQRVLWAAAKKCENLTTHWNLFCNGESRVCGSDGLCKGQIDDKIFMFIDGRPKPALGCSFAAVLYWCLSCRATTFLPPAMQASSLLSPGDRGITRVGAA